MEENVHRMFVSALDQHNHNVKLVITEVLHQLLRRDSDEQDFKDIELGHYFDDTEYYNVAWKGIQIGRLRTNFAKGIIEFTPFKEYLKHGFVVDIQ